MTGRAYMGEVLIKVWLKSISELLHKQVNAQKESLKNNFRGSHKLPQAHEKVCDEMKVELEEFELEEKNDRCLKYFLMEGRSL